MPFIYPGWDTGETYNPELPTGTDKKASPKEVVHPLSKGRRKSNLEVQKTLLTIYTLTQAHTEGEISPTLQHQLDCWGAEVLVSYPTLARQGKSTSLLPLTQLAPVIPKVKPKFYPHTTETDRNWVM